MWWITVRDDHIYTLDRQRRYADFWNCLESIGEGMPSEPSELLGMRGRRVPLRSPAGKRGSGISESSSCMVRTPVRELALELVRDTDCTCCDLASLLEGSIPLLRGVLPLVAFVP